MLSSELKTYQTQAPTATGVFVKDASRYEDSGCQLDFGVRDWNVCFTTVMFYDCLIAKFECWFFDVIVFCFLNKGSQPRDYAQKLRNDARIPVASQMLLYVARTCVMAISLWLLILATMSVLVLACACFMNYLFIFRFSVLFS